MATLMTYDAVFYRIEYFTESQKTPPKGVKSLKAKAANEIHLLNMCSQGVLLLAKNLHNN